MCAKKSCWARLKYLAVFFLIVLLWYWIGDLPRKKYELLTDAGAYGDSFGYVNSLFSGLALAGVIVSILLQSQELRLQREELKETREEMKRSTAAQEKSEQALATAAYLSALDTLRLVLSDEVATQEDAKITTAERELDLVVHKIRSIVLHQRAIAERGHTETLARRVIFENVHYRCQIVTEDFERLMRHDASHALIPPSTRPRNEIYPAHVMRALFYWSNWLEGQAQLHSATTGFDAAAPNDLQWWCDKFRSLRSDFESQMIADGGAYGPEGRVKYLEEHLFRDLRNDLSGLARVAMLELKSHASATSSDE